MANVPAYSGYYQEPSTAFSQPMAQNSMAYTPEYGQDSRQTQGYSAYSANMIYNVPQAGAQGSVYDTNQQFPPRQGAGLQMLPTDVTAPYFPGESANAATAAGLQPEQRMLQQGYTSTIAPMSGIAQTGAPEQVAEDPEYSAAAHAAAPTSAAEQAQMGEAYEQYQGALRDIFTDLHNGALQTAGVALMGVSEWLLTKVVELGLTADNEVLHQDRIKLWRDFNYAWLALCQKQKDMLESNSPLQRGQSLIAKEQLNKMGDDLVRLCNAIERHGLVDYECGVWEEQIIDILLKCMEACDANQLDPGSSASHLAGAGPSSQGPR